MYDMLAPVIKLNPLTYEELLVLTEKLSDIHAGYFGYERTLGTEDLVRFLQLEYGRVGADTHLTPREVIRDFVELLDILHQNPGTTIESILATDGSDTSGMPSDTGAPVVTTSAAGNTASVATQSGGVTLAGAAPLGSTAAGTASTIAGASRPAEGASSRDFSGFKL